MSMDERIDKPWGYELIWARTDRYVGKLIHVRRGESLSLQYHRVKDETFRVLSGRMRFRTSTPEGVSQERVLEEGDVVHVPPGLRHRVEALEDCDLVEVSTPELDDVVRLEDRYGRAGK
jgi:mannose-6-phosphate isomerase-like protein (cupin superfamily)